MGKLLLTLVVVTGKVLIFFSFERRRICSLCVLSQIVWCNQ